MRYRISMQLNERSLNRKLFVFHQENWEKVEDLENQIKCTFNISDLQLELFVDDYWIPSTEKIGVIKWSDEVVVREAPMTFGVQSTSQSQVAESISQIQVTSSRKASKKSTKAIVDNGSVSEKELLSSKKQELLSKVESFEMEDGMDVTDFDTIELPKKKRKRKHKKSGKCSLLAGVSLDSLQHPPPEATSAKSTEIASTLRKGHIRFDQDDGMDTTAPKSQEEERPEGWQQKLLSLAQERNKVVFTRRPVTNGVNGEAHHVAETTPSQSRTDVEDGTVTNMQKHIENGEDAIMDASSLVSVSLPMESPRTSDLMYFKKMIMKDFNPTVSDSMIAVVEEIGEENVLTLKICEGHAEQLFSPEEIQESEGDYLIVKLDWNKIIEPRLIVDQSLMSKYL